jgi:hypothetical protein
MEAGVHFQHLNSERMQFAQKLLADATRAYDLHDFDAFVDAVEKIRDADISIRTSPFMWLSERQIAGTDWKGHAASLDAAKVAFKERWERLLQQGGVPAHLV